MITNVNSTATLITALQTAQAGDTIQLAGGTYSNVNLQNLHFAQDVTITSQDPNALATISNMTIASSSGLTFQNLEFDRSLSTDAYAYQVNGSSNIAFDHLNVHGAAGTYAPSAFLINGSQDVALDNSTFTNLNRGVVFLNDNGLEFSGNRFTNMQTSGIVGAGASNVQVLDNYFADFHPVVGGQHPDAIQFFTTGTTVAAHDIQVSGNIFVRGSGDPIQGIFFRDTSGVMPYQNVTVTDNLVIGPMYNGIAVFDSNAVTLTGNTVAGFSDQLARINIDTVNGATLSNNVATFYIQAASTNVTETHDTTIGVPTDGGAAILQAWIAAHPTSEASIIAAHPGAPLATTTTNPPPTTTSPPVAPPATGSGQVLTSTYPGATLTGGAGADTLVASQGPDQLTGGAGADSFAFKALPWSAGHITDFQVGIDRLDISALYANGYTGSNPVADGYVSFVSNGAGGTKVLLDTDAWGSGNSLKYVITTLDGVAPGGLTAANVFGGSAASAPPTTSPPPSAGGQVLTATYPGATLTGSGGADTLVASQGPDQLTGAGGADHFVFAHLPWNAGHITDFAPGSDVLDLRALFTAAGYHGADPIADGTLRFLSDGAGDTRVLFSDPGSPWPTLITTLDHINPNQITSSDWLFH